MTRTALDKEKKRSREEQQRIRAKQDRLKQAEEAVAKAEKEAGDLEKVLADPETYKDPDAAAEITRQYQKLKEEINRLYSEWESLESEE